MSLKYEPASEPFPTAAGKNLIAGYEPLEVDVRLIIVTIRWTGLAPWEFESPFPGSVTSTHNMTPQRCIGLFGQTTLVGPGLFPLQG